MIKGKGAKARLVVEGSVIADGDIESISITVNGRRIPVTGGSEFKAVKYLDGLIKRIPPGRKYVGLGVVVKDSNGMTSATLRRVRIPKLDKYR